jgi:hypothetical protein
MAVYVTNKKFFFVISTFPAHHGASGFGSYRCHRISGTQTNGTDLIYGCLLVTPPTLGLVEFFGGGQMVSARGHGARSVIFDARICYSHCTDDYRGSGTKNVIFSNHPNFISDANMIS